jgi:hypothetical protein
MRTQHLVVDEPSITLNRPQPISNHPTSALQGRDGDPTGARPRAYLTDIVVVARVLCCTRNAGYPRGT